MPQVVDLCSPEPEESPNTAAAAALKSFQPRVQKQHHGQDGRRPLAGLPFPNSGARAGVAVTEPQKKEAKAQPARTDALTSFKTGPRRTTNFERPRAFSPEDDARAALARMRRESAKQATQWNERVDYEVPGSLRVGQKQRVQGQHLARNGTSTPDLSRQPRDKLAVGSLPRSTGQPRASDNSLSRRTNGSVRPHDGASTTLTQSSQPQIQKSLPNGVKHYDGFHSPSAGREFNLPSTPTAAKPTATPPSHGFKIPPGFEVSSEGKGFSNVRAVQHDDDEFGTPSAKRRRLDSPKRPTFQSSAGLAEATKETVSSVVDTLQRALASDRDITKQLPPPTRLGTLAPIYDGKPQVKTSTLLSRNEELRDKTTSSVRRTEEMNGALKRGLDPSTKPALGRSERLDLQCPCHSPAIADRMSTPESPSPTAPMDTSTRIVNTGHKGFAAQAVPIATPETVANAHGSMYTAEEDELLIRLKETEGLSWQLMAPYFPGRSVGSVQVRYSSKLKGRNRTKQFSVANPISTRRPDDTDEPLPTVRPQRKRNTGPSALDGMISWTDIAKQRRMVEEVQTQDSRSQRVARADKQWNGQRAHPKPVSKILRQRELGTDSARGFVPRAVPDELKEHILDDVGPRTYFKGTSSDVTCLAWAPDGNHFAAGSIAITDDRSMQYNKPNNLLLGDYGQSSLVELPEHHVPRPLIDDTKNPNGLHSMRETQDSRLFMTVANVQFSPDSSTLFSAGTDCKVRAYDVNQASCTYQLDHPSPLDLLSVSNTGLVATACHQSSNSIRVFDGPTQTALLSPSKVDKQTDRAIYPSALRWGAHPRHSNLLLAGFSIDSIDEERDMAGETCLWDLACERRVELGAITRNVFDVAWNPIPSSSSHSFAVACTAGTSSVGRGTRSVVQCFALRQDRHKARRVMELECPAFDINDVVYCQHDNNLLAAGATDGRVYVWDQRFASAGAQPLHILRHDDSLSVLDHDRDRELADTGIRFLSWGATSSRLYSGSSDGVVKIWNPYSSTENAHIKDIATFTSAIMSGAFSPDYRELLIGEDQGRINALSVGYGARNVRAMEPFKFRPAPKPQLHSNKPESHQIASRLVTTGEIELRSMGDLPIRQAVKGPRYKGPYYAPSVMDLGDAKLALREAQRKLNETNAQAPPMSYSSEDESGLLTANRSVVLAHEKIQDLEQRSRDGEALAIQANELQHHFMQRKKRKKKLNKKLPYRAERCKLDCNHLPQDLDDGGVPDSHRSEQRIPTSLWQADKIDVSSSIPADLVEAGLTSRCMTCLGPATKPEQGNRPQCTRCLQKSKGLTSSCDICASPIAPPSGTSTASKLCERCSFACFRCGKPAFIARDAAYVTCDSCKLTWRTGALGYEVLNASATTSAGRGKLAHSRSLQTEGEEEHVGKKEMEHYASQWGG